MPQIFIIIVTWNSEKYLPHLMLSLHDLDYPRDKWRLVVIDNGSQDNTLRILRQWQVKMHNFEPLILNASNQGFAVANNQGIRYALARDADYYVLLNDDAIGEPDWLKKIIPVMENNPKIGLTQPLITRYPETNLINSFGNCYQYAGFGYCSGEGVPLKTFFQKNPLADYEPSYLSFTAVVMRRAVMEQIGLLDENYFSYHEDTDYCFRARLSGWHLQVISDALVHHNYKFPVARNKIRYFWLEKNRLYLMLKFFRWRTLLLIFPAWLIMEFGLIFYSLVRGFFMERLKAYGWILAHLPIIFSARKQIQTARKIGDGELFKFITAKIDFQEINNPLLTYVGNPILSIYYKIIKKFII